jgi:hypothetical protein
MHPLITQRGHATQAEPEPDLGFWLSLCGGRQAPLLACHTEPMRVAAACDVKGGRK